MKSFRCLIGRHVWGDWVEVRSHLERECGRCPKVEVKYPDPLSTLIKIGGELLWRYYVWHKKPVQHIPPYSGYSLRWRENQR